MYSVIPVESMSGAAQMVIYLITAVALVLSLMLTARWSS